MHFDVGGRANGETIPREQHAFAPWELRVDALMWLLADATRPGGRRMTVDELRRAIEALPPSAYASLGYYERWLLAMIAILGERGLVDAAAIERRAAEIERAEAHP